ncbi:DUF7344 domain-containing protein [Halobaculum limi]|uniref:DUF7344 domain-containing protein n=1 Tax=Halobaculum limi TaxID=3031916 RepID=UPI002406B231|nr:hypothetical protein [Halobaculum sp. YSMS11]
MQSNPTRVPNPAELTDDLFDALSDTYRRTVLTTLVQSPETTFDEVCATLTDRINADTEYVGTVLYHTQLPYLAAREFIDYSMETRQIRQGPEFQTILPLLRLVGSARETLQISWP